MLDNPRTDGLHRVWYSWPVSQDTGKTKWVHLYIVLKAAWYVGSAIWVLTDTTVTIINLFPLLLPREHWLCCNLKTNETGVPAVVQWVKNLTAAAQVAVEAQIWSLACRSGLKDAALLPLQHKSQLQLKINPYPNPGSSLCLWYKYKVKKYSSII